MASTDKDAATKTRILNHMNADHSASLSLYLRNYSKLPAGEASKPTLVDISLSSLTISSRSGATHTIPLDPPMSSYAEARPRFVAMDEESRAALNISPYTITHYEPPGSFLHRTIFGLCLMTMAIFATKQYIVPGTFIYDDVLQWFPGGPKTFLEISNKITLPTIAIHLGEMVLLDQTKLSKYNRINAMIARQKKDKESKGSGGH
ncbi:hypothetical protein ACMFMG_002736 [Clarireedia jacksonii]